LENSFILVVAFIGQILVQGS